MSNLILVLDPDFGAALKQISKRAPVWIVETVSNREACEQLWRNSPRANHREIGAVTSFRAADANDRISAMKAILQQLETHHGEIEQDEILFPANFILEVVGIPSSQLAEAALKEFGFRTFELTDNGFKATK